MLLIALAPLTFSLPSKISDSISLGTFPISIHCPERNAIKPLFSDAGTLFISVDHKFLVRVCSEQHGSHC